MDHHEKEKETTIEEDDLISKLPSEILHRILSFIPTTSIILTSFISRSWKDLSKDHIVHTKNLDFGEDFAKKQKNPTKFIESLDKILSLSVPKTIDRFRLFFNPCSDLHKAKANEWIEFATSRDVQELDLDFGRHIRVHFLSHGEHVLRRNEAFELPTLVFKSRSINILKLSRCILVLPDTFSGLGYLHTMCLREVHVTCGMLETLLGCCPLLEVLVLRECGSLNKIKVMGNSKLMRLTLYECRNASVVEISAPNIKSLLLSAGHFSSCTFVGNMGVLEEAFVGTGGDEFGGVLYTFMKILPEISHIRILTLYLGYLVPHLIKDLRVTFSNLRELKLLNSSLFGVFSTDVCCFFKHCSCPLLENVSIKVSEVKEEEDFVLEFRKPKMDPVDCVFDNLKMLRLSNFNGNDEELEIITFFLERAPAFKSLILIGPQDPEHFYEKAKKEEVDVVSSDVEERFLKLLIASPDVNIAFSEDYEHDALLAFFKTHHVSDVYGS